MAKIGVFDSGIGGLGVLHEALKRMPDAEFVFYADRAHTPYGERTESEITDFARHITDFLIERGCGTIVIACNTATSVAAAQLRKEYGDIPILGMEPAVKPALEETDGRVMVIATPVTVRENKLKDLLNRIDKDNRVDVTAMPKLVRLAERELFESDEARLAIDELANSMDRRGDYSALVLGCTHFNYFRKGLKDALGEKILIFDGNNGTVRHLSDVTGERYLAGEFSVSYDTSMSSRVTYYGSDDRPVSEEELALYERLHRRLAEPGQNPTE